jgi:hypothetical protein
MLETYTFLHLIIPGAQFVIASPAEMQSINENHFTFQLPDKSYAVNKREVMRYPSLDLEAELFQNAFFAKGALIDFSPFGFRIKLKSDSVSSINWFNPDAPMTICIRKGDRPLFSSLCHCIRSPDENSEKVMVLLPSMEDVHQFQKTKSRNPRQQLIPSFEVAFNHPFLEKKIHRTVYDISTSGFSVFEEPDKGTLIPGMIIPDLTITYAGAVELICNLTQVLYRQAEGDGKVRCGIAILDMNIKHYTQLASITSQAIDPHACISFKVDLDELWSFFFETGFIYPEKYKSICANQKEFKKIYQKLYEEHPEIARHFIYQKNGRIYGHVTLARAYENTWMFQHLSARPMDKVPSGLMVMKQINHFTNELCRLPSAKMGYLMCYFQPHNRFSNFLFGGFARTMNNAQVCSLHLFSHLLYPQSETPGRQFPAGWELRKFSAEDLWELNRLRKGISGGLLMNVLHLRNKNKEGETLEEVYARLGFIRKSEIYSLVQNGVLKAVLLVNQANFGFNLSNLVNCIKILICDTAGLSREILYTAIHQLGGVYQTEKVPVLIYPSSFVEDNKIPFETKKYFMWIIDARFVSEFMDVTKKKAKISYWD